MRISPLLRISQFVAWGIRVERVPAPVWLGCIATALLPTWWWMARRVADRSDDPLGLLAVAALAILCWRSRTALRASPRLEWLTPALACALAATLFIGVLPPLLLGLLGVAALGCALAAFLPAHVASAPVLGLAALSLPWLASLQFYAGYPLRSITAEATRWLLMPFFAVERTGTALQVDGDLVIVDAPCSGVQLLWLGYFTACCIALFAGLRSSAFLARLPLVSVYVLAGNIVRNAALVALEAGGHGAAGWRHDAIGLGVLAAVSLTIAWIMTAGARDD